MDGLNWVQERTANALAILEVERDGTVFQGIATDLCQMEILSWAENRWGTGVAIMVGTIAHGRAANDDVIGRDRTRTPRMTQGVIG